MYDALIWPNIRKALVLMVDGEEHAGSVIYAAQHMEVDANGISHIPLALFLDSAGGNIGYVDRADRALIEVYAPGELAKKILESIITSLCGDGIEGPDVFFDSIQCIVPPTESPYPQDTLNLATAVIETIVRPLD
ncbi:hypothetical protein HD598_002166 [Neomicrococcus aestuarii]|uniref:Uncharacterized protein n=1 Tax=Neomicrococcus aestuarii TaxID=556325 RepID=A0A7W8TVA6_9MICC|nr:hypothetical protein [Neomicrococcus aestuarii]MBB5513479.1 hypothetical protein [Neomicrococcus aestuarii]